MFGSYCVGSSDCPKEARLIELFKLLREKAVPVSRLAVVHAALLDCDFSYKFLPTDKLESTYATTLGCLGLLTLGQLVIIYILGKESLQKAVFSQIFKKHRENEAKISERKRGLKQERAGLGK